VSPRRVALAVELVLDDAAQQFVGDLWDRLESAGIVTLAAASPRVHAHVSLGVATDTTPDALAATLGGVASAGLPVLALSSVGAFLRPQHVVFLAPVVTAELLALHATVCERLAIADVATSPLYAPGAWVPHCTIAMKFPSIAEALHAIGDVELPFVARCASVGLVEVPTGRIVATLG